MKVFRFSIIGASFALLCIAVILLANVTAPNPTGRRYSSEMPVITGSGTEIGISAERILAKDLRVPRNEDPDQRQCICNSPGLRPNVSECRVCYAYSQSIANYRRPDFVSSRYIAESKNRQGLLYGDRATLDQIGDYAVAARAVGVPLWVYVRVDTAVDPEFVRIARSTGGDIVPYFTVPGYADPVNRIAWYMVMVSSLGIVVVGLYWIGTRRVPQRPAPRPRKSTPDSPMSRATYSLDTVESFKESIKDRSRRAIDEEDAREEWDDE